jgi:hypothetical protein
MHKRRVLKIPVLDAMEMKDVLQSVIADDYMVDLTGQWIERCPVGTKQHILSLRLIDASRITVGRDSMPIPY